MRRLTTLLTTLIFTGFMLAACSDSSTGPGNEYSVSVTVTPEGSGSILPSADDTYEEGETVELEADANEGYLFTGWSGDVESTDNPLSITVDQEYSLTANFEKKSYTLTTNTQGEGSVDEQIVSNKTADYEHGTVVELTANPAQGWEFVEWTDAITGTKNPVELTIDEEKQVTAIFEEQSAFYLAGNGVTIKCKDASIGDTGTINGTTYTKRSASQITPGNAPTTCTSGITDMSGMFTSDDNFNGDISHWDVSSVTDMSSMFFDAASFNQNLSSWDVSSVTDMSEMFYETSSFNQNLNSWDVSSVTVMSRMFERNSGFNGDISSWDVSSVTDMSNMFDEATAFDGDLSGWDVSSVAEMGAMFTKATSFDADLSGWNVSNVVDMSDMFLDASSFNSDLSSWIVSSVTDMRSMFAGADTFNGNISSWNVSSVESMSSMFEHADSFNGNIGSWDVSNVASMTSMFEDAASFNQDISSWCVSNITSEPTNFSDGSPLTNDHKPEWGTCPGS